MKKTILIGIITLLSSYAKSQNLFFVANDETLIKDTLYINLPKVAITGQNINRLFFKAKSLQPGQQMTLKFNVDEANSTATQSLDYKYLTDMSASPKLTKKDSICYVDIKTITNKSTMTILNITSDVPKSKTYTIIINFNTPLLIVGPKKPAQMPDTSKWTVKIVTGGNFDFFSGPVFKNFAGEINAFRPNIYKKWGIQFSLFNFHYFQTDSGSSYRSQDYYFLKSQDYYNTTDSSKVVRRNYAVNRKVDYNIWGAYIDPMFQVYADQLSQVYLSLHIEGLLTTEIYTPKINYLSRDTILHKYLPKNISPADDPPVPYSYRSESFHDFYLGAGVPLKFSFSRLMLSAYPIFGVAFIQTNNNPDNAALDYYLRYNLTTTTAYKPYFVTKFQILTTVAPVDIALGGEYRVVIGNLRYLTTYLGAAISLDKLKK